MENEIYERNYALERAQKAQAQKYYSQEEIAAEIFQNDFFRLLQEHMAAIPKYVVPQDKENYDYLLERCDRMAEQWGGRVYGIVDYQNFQSTIRLTLPFIEFSSDEELLFLKDIAEKSRTVSFSAKEPDQVTLSIFIDYFDEVDGDRPELAKKAKMIYLSPKRNKE